MTGVIKLNETAAASVRPLSAARGPSAPARAQEPVVDPELAALRLESETLVQRLVQREAEIKRLEQDVERGLREGEAKGRKAGLEEADDLRRESLVKLEDGLERATKLFLAEMSSLERLAALLAHESLARILDDKSLYADLLEQTIRGHLAKIETQAVVHVVVSRADFADPSQLASLASAVTHPGLDIHASDDLAAGDCRIKLRLGTLEVGIGQQWSRLGAALQALAEPGDAA